MVTHRLKKRENSIVFGDFIVAMCAAWGQRKGPRMVQLAVNRHMVEFLGGQHFLISELIREEESTRAPCAAPDATDRCITEENERDSVVNDLLERDQNWH